MFEVSISMDETTATTAGARQSGGALDPAALWTAFAPPLRGFLGRRLPPGVEVDDVLQDVFVRVVRRLDSLRTTERPEAWLFQIARNALNDVLRARQRRDGRTDSLEADVQADAVDDSRTAEAELAPCLAPMIARLAEPYRSAIVLTSVRGLTQAAAAREAGITVSGMKSRVQRGRDHLRQMLAACCEIAVDVRGGVSDFHPKPSGGGCGGPVASSNDSAACGCSGGAPRASASRS